MASSLLLSRLNALDVSIRALGIPIAGVALLTESPPTVSVDYQVTATAPQRTQGNSIASSFDWSQAADDATSIQLARTFATSLLNAFGSDQAVLLRAFAAVLADEINICRAAIPRGILSITRVTTTATAITRDPHGLQTGDTIRVQGATLAAYNVTAVATVVNATTFTYPVAGSPVTPAVGPGIQFTLGSVVPSMAPRTLAQARTAILAKIAAGLVDT